ncbi:3-hydroxyacyl-CoA dehydrogenase NAD-binding domain-containing protein [Chelativorans sp. Marseille-P2723]|uniref:3-hydroxyacyl-CoA dehydrogenase NAD-binding domain-containing protein n=1 Tax=Chelativorans sp. Marseille-P2723 TaxID=2709133 RepID=UPI00156D97F2|nr:3-hydroxyacyl-CoA dehydrogenase NAD-binding domain-containing protein [Chelativorans sp. Marseille-P2723]
MAAVEALSETVSAERRGDILFIRTDNPPLNLLSASVRQGIQRGLSLAQTMSGLRALVLTCAGDSGFSGADMSEFGRPIAPPELPELIEEIAAFPLPVIAALNGRTLGGGFEVALACRSRIASPKVRVALPEIRLGLIPGAGGIERVTRMAGIRVALDVCLSGREIGAEEALKMGLIDRIADGDLIQAALDLAQSEPPLRLPVHESAEDIASAISEWRRGPGRRLAKQSAPEEAIALIETAAANPELSLRSQTVSAFQRLERGPQSAALRHLFAAERSLRDLPFLPEGTKPAEIHSVGIVGAGTMGSGIATAMLMSGLPVVLSDNSAEALARGRALVAANLDGAVKRGKITGAACEAALDRLTLAEDTAALSDVDLIIEAVYESMPVKLEVFARLDAVAKPDAILASNTSFLDIDRMAEATGRPEKVLGMHFFSPANVMRLLEVVRGAKTGAREIATAVELGRRIGKTVVCVGNCYGFVGNRILIRRQNAAMDLLLAGHDPYAIDRAMTDFGLPMGPFAMADLAGLDVGWDREGTAGRTIEEVMCEAGRFGRKSGGGYYDYDEKGQARPSPAALALISDFRKRNGMTGTREAASDEWLLEQLLAPMFEEIGRIIDEGIVLRASDIDVIWVHGYGWPAWRGGPAWYREHRHLFAKGA